MNENPAHLFPALINPDVNAARAEPAEPSVNAQPGAGKSTCCKSRIRRER